MAGVEELLDLVLADVVMLAAVEDRDQDVEVRQHRREGRGAGDGDGVVRPLAPVGELGVERVSIGADRVAEGLEDGPEKRRAAADRQDVEPGLQGDRRRGQVGPGRAAALERRAEDLGDGDAQERRRDVGPIVDVLVRRALRGPLAADEADGVDVQHQGGLAAVGGGLRVEDVGTAEAQVVALEPIGVLVQEEAEVVGRRLRGRDRQQHRAVSSSDRGRAVFKVSDTAGRDGFGIVHRERRDRFREACPGQRRMPRGILPIW